jgi:hypothetical protein
MIAIMFRGNQKELGTNVDAGSPWGELPRGNMKKIVKNLLNILQLS